MQSNGRSLFPKARVDALSDGIFAFAMTLLVLDIRLPDDLPLTSASELAAHLLSLSHQTLTYVISFFVLGAFWRGGIEIRPTSETVDGRTVRLALLFLFFVTTVPFSSGLVGRYGGLAPAVVVYAGNMTMLAVLTIAIRYLDVEPHRRSLRSAVGGVLPLFIATAILSVLISLVAPGQGMYAYLLNALARLPFWPRGGYGEPD
jgi:uncharacterized membrane protein